MRPEPSSRVHLGGLPRHQYTHRDHVLGPPAIDRKVFLPTENVLDTAPLSSFEDHYTPFVMFCAQFAG